MRIVKHVFQVIVLVVTNHSSYIMTIVKYYVEMGMYRKDLKNVMMVMIFHMMVVINVNFNVQIHVNSVIKVFVKINVNMVIIYLIMIIVIQYVEMEY